VSAESQLTSGREAAVQLVAAALQPGAPLAESVIDVVLTAGLAEVTLAAVAELAADVLQQLATSASLALGTLVTPRQILRGEVG